MILPPRVLFIGAHCDDIELIAGGLLARACYAGRAVGVLVFSDHRGVIDDDAAHAARAEFRDNLAWLTAQTGAPIEDHSDRMLPACRGAFEAERAALYARMEALRDRYDLVVTHAPTDTNQDHRQVAAEAARVFKAHASLLGGEFPNNDLGDFCAQVYVPLAPRELDAKRALVARYRSQRFGGRPYLDPAVVDALARVRGAQVREPAAEAYCVSGRVVLR
ncbi:MAG: PIG-L family deacetylase [Polyangiales bacterium]